MYNLDEVKEFCLKELDMRHYNIDVIISECCLKHDRALGWCYDIHEGEIDIEIEQTLSAKDKILTLCHEMVHARQACRGDETFCEDEANKLEGELYNGFIYTTEGRWDSLGHELG